MANEIGYWNSGAGAGTAPIIFPGDAFSVVGTGAIYTAGAGQRITKVRVWRASGGPSGAQSVAIGLYLASGGLPTGSSLFKTTISMNPESAMHEATVSWALTAGLSYALALGESSTTMNISADTFTNGTSVDDTGNQNPVLFSWTHASYKAVKIELAGDVTIDVPVPILSRRTYRYQS